MDPIERGRWFHRTFFAKAAAMGLPHDHHADSDEHDFACGLALEIAFGGQPETAERYYADWALRNGYEGLRLLSADPLDVAFPGCVIRFTPDDLEVFPSHGE